MKFEFLSTTGQSFLKAIVETEEEKQGFRAEGPYPLLKMVNDTVIFDYEIKTIHPDILALLCITCFYPYLDQYVTFPQPVSRKIEEAFGENGVLKLHEVIDGRYQQTKGIKVTNIDDSITPYKGSKLAISFGGGMDSSALYKLIPEAIVIHEQTKLNNGEIQLEKTLETIDLINGEGGQAFSFANNNRRGISEPSGWPGWAACTCNALLLSTDFNIGYIMTGSVIGASFLSNGRKYFPGTDTLRKNKWIQAFELVGIPMFSPTGGLSEVANAIILHKTNFINKAHWCFRDQGSNCQLCWKCFRRDTILFAIGALDVNNEFWERYNTDFIKKQLVKRPIYFAHIFSFTLRKLEHLTWLKPFIPYDVENTSDWICNSYTEAIKLVPEELRHLISERIVKFIEPMKDESKVENWDCTY